jgi:glutamine amidotransferase
LSFETVSIVNYGVGNIAAFHRAFKHLGVDVTIADTASKVKTARKLVLPGVGSFDWAVSRLEKSGLYESLDQVVGSGTFVLGVCVGMQMLLERSEEGRKSGLGWIKGDVAKISRLRGAEGVVTPVMGWAETKPIRDNGLFNNMKDPRFYYLHSYCAKPSDPQSVIAVADIGVTIVSAVQQGHIFGTQFHPEKSHAWGTQLLRNFLDMR